MTLRVVFGIVSDAANPEWLKSTGTLLLLGRGLSMHNLFAFDSSISAPGAIPERARGLEVSAPITTLAGMRDGSGPSGLGRVTCFGVRRGARRWAGPVLLTCHHVLHAHGAAPGDLVFAPDVADEGGLLGIDPASLAPVAEVTEDGLDGVHRFVAPGRAERDYYVDCATARLVDSDAVPSGAAAFRVGFVHPHDALLQRRLAVRLLGVHDRPAGEVVATDALVERADGVLCPGTIAIRSHPGGPPFATEGGSGALVVDRHDRAIGLLWGVDLEDPAMAYACHVLPVLDRLDLVPSLRSSVTGPQTKER